MFLFGCRQIFLHYLIEKVRYHLFPSILFGLFVLFVGIGLHGSSVGEWGKVFREKTDSYSFDQIGVSRGIRVDDWCVSQPFIFAQCASEEYFPRINRNVNDVIPEENWEQKNTDVIKHNIDVFVMGDDWEGKFDFLKDKCEGVYLPRTPEISTTQIKASLKENQK